MMTHVIVVLITFIINDKQHEFALVSKGNAKHGQHEENTLTGDQGNINEH